MILIRSSDKNNFKKREWVKLVNSLSGPKSVNLLGTTTNSGQTNLAIISSVFHLGSEPPLMGFILRPHSAESPRHSLLNIKESKYFTINHVNSKIYKLAHQTSARYDRNQSEFELCGLSSEYIDNFTAPFVKESNIKIGLKLIECLHLKQNNTNLIIGEIKLINLKENYLRQDGSIDIQKADSIAVSGLDEYHKLDKIARLSYAKPSIPVQEIFSDINEDFDKENE